MRGVLDKLFVIARRDLLTMVRYRGGFWIQLLSILGEVAGFYFLARAIGPAYRPQGIGYFSFLLVGTGFYAFLMSGMSAFVESVRDAQVTGTMEVLMTTSTPGPVIILLSALSAFSGRAAHFVFSLVLGFVVFGVTLNEPNVIGCVLIFVLSLLVAVALGLTVAATQVLVQKGSSILWLIGAVAGLMTGTMFPIEALPRPLLLLAKLIPITYSLEGLRLSLLRDADYSQLAKPLTVLTAYVVVLLPLSLWFLSRALRTARLHGTLSSY